MVAHGAAQGDGGGQADLGRDPSSARNWSSTPKCHMVMTPP